VKTAIFDFDGTLFESASYWGKVINQYLMERKIIPPENILSIAKPLGMEGADMVVYNCAYGKVPSLVDRYVRIGQCLLSDFHGLKPTFPSPAAGMHPGLVGQVMDDLTQDIN
jgi:ribulose 1,5-bisphosphate carboxylase large subunit-like protein